MEVTEVLIESFRDCMSPSVAFKFAIVVLHLSCEEVQDCYKLLSVKNEVFQMMASKAGKEKWTVEDIRGKCINAISDGMLEKEALELFDYEDGKSYYKYQNN